MNVLSITMAVAAALVAYWFGRREGIRVERDRIRNGIHFVQGRVASPVIAFIAQWLYHLNDELFVSEVKEYAADMRREAGAPTRRTDS